MHFWTHQRTWLHLVNQVQLSLKLRSLLVYDTGVNAILLISSMKPLYMVTQQFCKLYDAFGVHSNVKYLQASDVLQEVETSLQFYRNCQSDIREMLELLPDKNLDGSLGSPSRGTVNSLDMEHESKSKAMRREEEPVAKEG